LALAPFAYSHPLFETQPHIKHRVSSIGHHASPDATKKRKQKGSKKEIKRKQKGTECTLHVNKKEMSVNKM